MRIEIEICDGIGFRVSGCSRLRRRVIFPPSTGGMVDSFYLGGHSVNWSEMGVVNAVWLLARSGFFGNVAPRAKRA